jgi:putative CocE/NonD family hydrolase
MIKLTILTLFCSIVAGSQAEELKVIVERNVPVPMRDGTILRADVHRPDRGGPYPVLVRRTRNDKYKEFNMFVTAGYIVVNQDVRGCFRSEGTFRGIFTPREMTHDAEDGYDTVEWAARLPNSTGKVGTFGTSYEAYVQWRLAPLRPPSLMAMSACSIMAHFDNEHGAFRPLLLDFYNLLSPEMRRRADRPGVHTRTEASVLWAQGESEKWIHWLPWLDLPREIFEDETEAVRYWLENPQSDPWRHDESCKDITVPNLDVVGWYDHANGNMLLSQTMFKEAGSEVARKGSRLIVGPWTHALGRRYVGDMDFGAAAELSINDLCIQWFDYWLKGIPNGFASGLRVRLFVMGDNIWRDEEHWPLERTREKAFFIASDGQANSAGGDGRLIGEEPPSPGTDRYVYDPRDPIPTQGETLIGVVIRSASDQRPLAKRRDILVFQTQPLSERIEVTGFPVVELYAASSQPDTDWFVRLIDVYPDGLALDVSQGFVRARYRNGVDKPELIKPGEVIKYKIRMKPTSNAFLPGHRIRLDITSSDFPNYDRSHNTAADQHKDPELAVAEQTVFHGGARATRIILPWVPGPKQEAGPAKENDRQQPQRPTYPLHQAATEGDIGQIKRLISEGADINLRDAEGETPLYRAITAGKTEVVQYLIEAGADINAGKLTTLYAAVDANDIATAKNLIAHGANVNPPHFWTPLQQAPYSSSLEMVRLLLDKGADMKAGPWTVWQSAIENSRKDILELLFQRGLDMNATEEQHGMSVLGFALAFHKDDMVDYLLARGAKLARGLDRNGLTPLHHAAQMGYKNIDRFGPAIRDDIDERDSLYGFTALHYAARFGQKQVAEVLIANGADVRAKDKWGYQPLHWAAYHDRPEIIELLISKGADVNAKTSLDQTPIELAIPRRNTAVIEVLRKHGAKE